MCLDLPAQPRPDQAVSAFRTPDRPSAAAAVQQVPPEVGPRLFDRRTANGAVPAVLGAGVKSGAPGPSPPEPGHWECMIGCHVCSLKYDTALDKHLKRTATW